MKAVSRVLATFFGVGLFPLVPGTAASAVAALGFKLALKDLSWPFYVVLVALIFFCGASVSGRQFSG